MTASHDQAARNRPKRSRPSTRILVLAWAFVLHEDAITDAEDQDYFQRYTDGHNQFSPYRSAAG